jgi:hypothetical protein
VLIWSRPRVNTLSCLCLIFHFLSLLPSLPSSLHHLLVSLAILCNRKYPIRRLKLSSSILVVLQASQTVVVFYQLSVLIASCTSGLFRFQLSSTNYQVQLLPVLPDFSGFNCLLPCFQVQLQLYFRTTQVTIFFYVFKILSSTVFFGVFIWLLTSNFLA